MFHIPAHRSGSAAQFEPRNHIHVCGQCGGHPDMDDEGKFYTCFHCCDTGLVPMEEGFEDYANRATWAAEPRVPAYVSKPRVVEYDDGSNDIPF